MREGVITLSSLIKFELNVDAAAKGVGGEEAEEYKRGIGDRGVAEGHCEYPIVHLERSAKIISDTINSTSGDPKRQLELIRNLTNNIVPPPSYSSRKESSTSIPPPPPSSNSRIR
jgi:hypothetical protein